MVKAVPAVLLAGAGLLAAITVPGPAAAQAATYVSQPMPKLDQELQAIVADRDKPLASLSALAIRDGKIVYQQSFGYRRIGADGKLPADSNTLYRVASISKLVTSIGALRLVEQGRLELDADIGKYLGFALRNPHFPDVAITPRMLLSHTSSLRDEGGYSFPVDTTLRGVLLPAGQHYGQGLQWAAPSADSERAPGKYFEYCNLNWGVLGSIIEAVSGQRFDRYMQQAVLAPLQIAGGYNPEEFSQDDVDKLAALYRKQASDETWNSAGPWVVQADDYQGKLPARRKGLEYYVLGSNATLFSPQGGLRISAGGLARLMLMLMNGGELDGARILNRDSVQSMLSEQWRYDAARKNGDNYQGLYQVWSLGAQKFVDVSAAHSGDRLVAGGGLRGYGHLGFAYGLNAGFVFDPVARNGMIYIIGGVGADPAKNRGAYSSLNIWEEQVLEALYRGAIAGP